MSKKSYRQAINEAIRQEMRRDHRVIIMGEDISGGTGAPGDQDAWGGPLGVTKGLRPEFGPERVLDTHLAEISFVGAAAHCSANTARPAGASTALAGASWASSVASARGTLTKRTAAPATAASICTGLA